MKLKVVSRGVVSVSLPLPNPGTDNINVNNNTTPQQTNQEFIKKEVPDEEQGLVLALFTPDLSKSTPSTSTTPPSQVSSSKWLYMYVFIYMSYVCVCFLLFCS